MNSIRILFVQSWIIHIIKGIICWTVRRSSDPIFHLNILINQRRKCDPIDKSLAQYLRAILEYVPYIRYVKLKGRHDFKVAVTDGIAAGSIGLGGMQVNIKN